MEGVSFSLIISIVGGFATLGTVFGYFFSLRERVSKVEVANALLKEEIVFIRGISSTLNDKLGSIETSLMEIKTAFHYYKEQTK